MERDPMMSAEALAEREKKIQSEREQKRQAEQERESELQRKSEIERKATEELRAQLAQEAERRRQEEEQIRQTLLANSKQRTVPDPAYNTLGGRGAAMDRTALGERDALRPRYPDYHQDPMTSRSPRAKKTVKLDLDETDEKYESPWFLSIRGSMPITPPEPPPASP
jgi:hypothetical protein